MSIANGKFSGDGQILLKCPEELLQGNDNTLPRVSAMQSEACLLCKIRKCNISDEITVYSAIKNIVSEKPVTGRAAGSREPMNYAAICDLFILAGICVFLFLYFFSDLATSHRFIITYIHNLDGMKP